jgi:hypothetical protein
MAQKLTLPTTKNRRQIAPRNLSVVIMFGRCFTFVLDFGHVLVDFICKIKLFPKPPETVCQRKETDNKDYY